MASALHSILFCIFCLLTLDKISPYVEVLSDIQPFLQPSTVSDDDYFRDLSCYRPCENSPPRICYYKWELSNYKTMGPACRRCPANVTDCFREQCVTADGYERGITAVNHQLPGPSIQVCYGDRIIVDVVNKLSGESTTIHWHGVEQKKSPHMDGVPMITQCPIEEFTTFRYDFIASTAGTLYWHSHNGVQKQDGMQGALVVRTPKSQDPNSHLYVYDFASHVIFISDWTRLGAGEHVPGLQTHDKFQLPDSILLNGRGKNMVDSFCPETPYNVFTVRQGATYRFRLVVGTCTSCAYRFTIEQHTLLVIAADGSPIEPVRVNSIDIYGGERYDFVLEASEKPRSYWIHVKSIGNCEDLRLYSLGILRYRGAIFNTLIDPGYMAYPAGKVMNIFNGTCCNRKVGVCIDQLVSLNPVPPEITTRQPDVIFKLTFGFHQFSVDELFQPGKYNSYFEPRENALLSGVVNNISFQFPSSPLLSQRGDISKSIFCPTGYDRQPRCPPGSENFCTCLHLIWIPLHAVAEFILIDKGGGGINHPFHMHGYYFSVIAMGQFKKGQTEDDIIKALSLGTLPISKHPAFKDTIAVPASGYAVIRILAENPGYWFFHCHVLYHAGAGMSFVLQVGKDSDVSPPPAGFPKCGNFIPPVQTLPSYKTSNNTVSTLWYS